MMYNKTIDSYISYSLVPDEVEIYKEYPDSIYWVKDGEVIVEIENSENFWLRNDIWKSISGMFNFNYDETQSIIKIWLGTRHSKLGELTPHLQDAILRYGLGRYSNL